MALTWDWDIWVSCSQCDASLWEDFERAFSYAPHSYLCRDCATERGGVFDEELEAWTTPPEIEVLTEPRDSGEFPTFQSGVEQQRKPV